MHAAGEGSVDAITAQLDSGATVDAKDECRRSGGAGAMGLHVSLLGSYRLGMCTTGKTPVRDL